MALVFPNTLAVETARALVLGRLGPPTILCNNAIGILCAHSCVEMRWGYALLELLPMVAAQRFCG
jgi:GAF domain-containing protein